MSDTQDREAFEKWCKSGGLESTILVAISAWKDACAYKEKQMEERIANLIAQRDELFEDHLRLHWALDHCEIIDLNEGRPLKENSCEAIDQARGKA